MTDNLLNNVLIDINNTTKICCDFPPTGIGKYRNKNLEVVLTYNKGNSKTIQRP